MTAAFIEAPGLPLKSERSDSAMLKHGAKTAAIVLAHEAAPTEVKQALLDLATMDHPPGNVLVVDCSVHPGCWEPVAVTCAQLGPRFRFFHLGNPPSARRAAMNFALQELPSDVAEVWLMKPGTSVQRCDRPQARRPALSWPRHCLHWLLDHIRIGQYHSQGR